MNKYIFLVLFWGLSLYFAFDYGIRKERLKFNEMSNNLLYEQKKALEQKYKMQILDLQNSNDKLNDLYNSTKSKGNCFDADSIKIFNSLLD